MSLSTGSTYFIVLVSLCQFGFKMETEASRGLGYGGVPGGTSSKNRPMGNEGIRLKANWHQAQPRIALLTIVFAIWTM